MARPVDVSPSGPLALPTTGIGSGWEPAAIMTLTLLLLSLGLVTLYSASAFLAQGQAYPDYYYALRQATGAAAGLAILGVCAWIPHDLWRRLALPMVIVVWILLIIVIAPGTEAIAPLTKGARRWLRVGGLSLQPSELAKVVVVVWTASRAFRKQEEFSSLSRGLVPFLLVWAALMVPIALEPDFSTALLVGVIGCLVVYVAGARLTHFLFLGLLAAPVLYSQLGRRLPGSPRDRVPEPFGGSGGRRLPGAPVTSCVRLGRRRRRRVRTGPAEVRISSGGPQRFHLRDDRGRMGTDRRHGDGTPLPVPGPDRFSCRGPCSRPLWTAAGGWADQHDRHAGHPSHGRGTAF